MACSLDLPQGLPKKIQFDLLLADLALELGDLLARRIRRRDGRLPRRASHNTCRRRFRWPAPTAQRLRSARSEPIAPDIEVFTQNLEFACERAHVLPGE